MEKILSSIELKFHPSVEYTRFIKKYNVVDFGDGFCVKVNKTPIPVEVIFGFSKNASEDLLKINDSYEHRIPEGYFAIAAINYGDLACLGKNGEICHWNHEVNDLYFSKDGGGYKKQNKKMPIIEKSLDLFIKSIEICKEKDEYVAEEDEYNNPNTPFPDSSLSDDFKRPEGFFKNPAHLMPIYLRKLELSQKGRELIKIFKEKSLL